MSYSPHVLTNFKSSDALYAIVKFTVESASDQQRRRDISAYCLAACNAMLSARLALPTAPGPDKIHMPAAELAMCITVLSYALCDPEDPTLNTLITKLAKASASSQQGFGAILEMSEAVISSIPAGTFKIGWSSPILRNKATIQKEIPRLLAADGALVELHVKMGVPQFTEYAKRWGASLDSRTLQALKCEQMAWGLIAGNAHRKVPPLMGVRDPSPIRSLALCMDPDLLQRQCAMVLGIGLPPLPSITQERPGSAIQKKVPTRLPRTVNDAVPGDPMQGPPGNNPTLPIPPSLPAAPAPGQNQPQPQLPQVAFTPVSGSTSAVAGLSSKDINNIQARMDGDSRKNGPAEVDTAVLSLSGLSSSNRCLVHQGVTACTLQVNSACVNHKPENNRVMDPYFEGLVFQTHECKIPAYCFAGMHRCIAPTNQSPYILQKSASSPFSDGQVAPYCIHALVVFKRMAVAHVHDLWGAEPGTAPPAPGFALDHKVLTAILSPFMLNTPEPTQSAPTSTGRAVRGTYNLRKAWVPMGTMQPPSSAAQGRLILTEDAMPLESEAQRQAAMDPLTMLILTSDLLKRSTQYNGSTVSFVLFAGMPPPKPSAAKTTPSWLAGIVISECGGMREVLYTNGCVVWHSATSFSDPPSTRTDRGRHHLLTFSSLQKMLQFSQMQRFSLSPSLPDYMEASLLQAEAFSAYVNIREGGARATTRVKEMHVKRLAEALAQVYSGFGE
jgi:hypothetical protein